MRREYVRKPYIRAVVPVNCSEPKAVAGHVRKREDKIVAVVAPPVGKKARIGGGGEKEKGEGGKGEGGERGDGDGNGNGEGEGGDEPDPVGVDVADDEDESGEEYESAPEDPWPEEVWNDTPSGLKCAPLSAISRVEAELVILSNAERRKIAVGNFEYQEKNRLLGSHTQYSLFARGRQVWRLEAYFPTRRVSKSVNEFERIHLRRMQVFFEAWENRVEIDEQMLEDAGWCWQAREQQWYTETLQPDGSDCSLQIHELPFEIKKEHCPH